MLAFLAEKAERCVMCGTAGWEWDAKQGGNRFAYEAVQHTCPGCYVKEAAAEDLPRNAGVTVQLQPTNTPAHYQRLARMQQMARRGGDD